MAVGSILSDPSKMPSKSLSKSAFACKVGAKLAKIEGSVCFNCYALRGFYRMDNVKAKHERVKNFIEHIDFVPRMVATLYAECYDDEYFRWWDSGDVWTVQECLDVLEVCEKTPWLKHWIPSKEYKLWRDALKIRDIPKNAVVRFSTHMNDLKPTKAGVHTSTTFTVEGWQKGKEKTYTPEQIQEFYDKTTSEAKVGNICMAKKFSAENNRDKGKHKYSCGDCRDCWDSTISNIAYPLRK